MICSELMKAESMLARPRSGGHYSRWLILPSGAWVQRQRLQKLIRLLPEKGDTVFAVEGDAVVIRYYNGRGVLKLRGRSDLATKDSPHAN